MMVCDGVLLYCRDASHWRSAGVFFTSFFYYLLNWLGTSTEVVLKTNKKKHQVPAIIYK